MVSGGRSGSLGRVYLGGYTLDETGICMWPLRRYTARWCDLVDLRLRRTDGQHAHYVLAFQFSSRAKPVNVRVGAGIAGVRIMARLFQGIRQMVPRLGEQHRGLFDEVISIEDCVSDERLSVDHPSDEERLARARFWWWALDPKRALRECKALIRDRGPLEMEAVLLAIDAHLANGMADDAVAVFEDTMARHGDDPRILARGATLLLDGDHVRGESLAEQVVSRSPDEAPKIGLHWAWYHFRARRWSEALAVLDRVERSGSPLPKDFAEEFTRVRSEVAACQTSPARGFRQTVGRRWLAFLLQIGIPVLILALLTWPVVKVGPIFVAEARKLDLLEARGVHADATCVRDLRRHDVKETELAELSFVFSPDPGTAESWEIGDLASLDRESLNAYIERITSGQMPRGWYRGHAILYKATAKEIEGDVSRQVVTYLRDDPSINTIGPITWTRVWLTWLAGGKVSIMAALAVGLLVYLGVLVARDWLRRRAGRRKVA